MNLGDLPLNAQVRFSTTAIWAFIDCQQLDSFRIARGEQAKAVLEVYEARYRSTGVVSQIHEVCRRLVDDYVACVSEHNGDWTLARAQLEKSLAPYVVPEDLDLIRNNLAITGNRKYRNLRR